MLRRSLLAALPLLAAAPAVAHPPRQPDTAEAQSIVEEIKAFREKIAKAVTDKDFPTLRAAYADAFTKYSTTFEVQASFEGLVRLLYELERPPYGLWVEGAVVTADRDAGFLRTTVTVSVYAPQPKDEVSDEES